LAIEVDKEEKIPIFQRMISEMGPDATIEIVSLRPTENAIDTLKLLVVLGKAPISATEAPEHEDENLEFKVRNLVFADYMFYQLDPASFTGVVVSELKAGGLSDVGGLELGDIIQRIDDYQITSVEDAREALDQMAASKTSEIIFFVWRDSNTLFINVKTDWE
jgi:membrane-associated protease RseP (regulator of RpoE activity)